MINTKRVVMIRSARNLLNNIFPLGTALVSKILIVFFENSLETKSAAKMTTRSGMKSVMPCSTTCIPELCNDNHSKNRCND